MSVNFQSLEFKEGRNAFCDGIPKVENPYRAESNILEHECSVNWYAGWKYEKALEDSE